MDFVVQYFSNLNSVQVYNVSMGSQHADDTLEGLRERIDLKMTMAAYNNFLKLKDVGMYVLWCYTCMIETFYKQQLVYKSSFMDSYERQTYIE